MSPGLNVFSDALRILSSTLGAEEAAVRLLLSILSVYLLAIFYRKYLYGGSKHVSHAYFIITSLVIGYLNFGNDIIHVFSSIIITYGILATIGGTALSVALVFSFNLAYLLIGYHLMSTENYDINWTMPHCVLTLRLIGVAFDYYDGQQDEETLSSDGKRFMLKKLPSPLEFAGFSCFPAGFLVGPQFPMRRYQSYVNNEFSEPGKEPDSENEAYKRLTLGLIYLGVFQLLGMFVSNQMFSDEDFVESSFIWRHFLTGLWGKYTLTRYIACWLLAEGSCILFGITYNGTDEQGVKLWNGLENVKLSILENCIEFGSYVHSFNINTNKWLAHYIYKRLKFLNNRHLSQLGALMFLAIWHGYHSGYFLCFFLEYIVIYMERDLKAIVESNNVLKEFFANSTVDFVFKIILRLYTFIFMGFCLMPFVLLTREKYWEAFGSINYSGMILFMLYPVLWGPILRFMLKKKRKD